MLDGIVVSFVLFCELASWIYPSTRDANSSITHDFADDEPKDDIEPEFINCDLLENTILIDNLNNIIRGELIPSSDDVETRESGISIEDVETNIAASDELYVFEFSKISISSKKVNVLNFRFQRIVRFATTTDNKRYKWRRCGISNR